MKGGAEPGVKLALCTCTTRSSPVMIPWGGSVTVACIVQLTNAVQAEPPPSSVTAGNGI